MRFFRGNDLLLDNEWKGEKRNLLLQSMIFNLEFHYDGFCYSNVLFVFVVARPNQLTSVKHLAVRALCNYRNSSHKFWVQGGMAWRHVQMDQVMISPMLQLHLQKKPQSQLHAVISVKAANCSAQTVEKFFHTTCLKIIWEIVLVMTKSGRWHG